MSQLIFTQTDQEHYYHCSECQGILHHDYIPSHAIRYHLIREYTISLKE